MNSTFWETLGYDPSTKKHLASEWMDMIHHEDLEIAKENIGKHLENPEHPYDQNVRYNHKNGSTVWVRCRGLAIRNKEGKPIRMLGAHTDITALKVKEQELEYERNKLRSFLESSELATWELDTKKEKIKLGPRYFSFLGYDKDEVEDEDEFYRNSVHPSDLDKIYEIINLYNTGMIQKVKVEYRAKHKSGNWKWLLALGSRVNSNGDGAERNSISDTIFGTVQDITSKRQIELSLAQSHRIKKIFIEMSPLAKAMFDKDMRYLAFSPKWTKMLGINDSYLIGEELRVGGRNLQELRVLHEKAIKDRETHFVSDFSLEIGGELKFFKAIAVSPSVSNGTVSTIFYLEDVTEKNEKQSEIEKYNDLLSKAGETALIGTWEVNLDDMTSYMSPVTRAIHEIPEDFETNVENGIDFYKPGENRERISDLFNRSITEGVPFNSEFEIITHKGNEKWVRSIGIPTIGKDGKCNGIYGLFQDISQQKHFELELQDRQVLSDTLLEILPDTVLLIGKDRRVIKHNNLQKSGFFTDRIDFVGSSIKEVFKENTLSLVEKHLAESDESQNGSSEFLIKRTDSKKWFEFRVGKENSLGHILSIRDVTDKEVEKES
ncbi:MAG: hypothetical protein Kapaf2KO_11380 [Candidatus Kapaibacteriales bacterium]